MNCTIVTLNETVQTCIMKMCSKEEETSETVILMLSGILLAFLFILYIFKLKYYNILIKGTIEQKKATNDLMFELKFISLLVLSGLLPYILKTLTSAAFIIAFCTFDFEFLTAILKAHRNMKFDGLIAKKKDQRPDEESLINKSNS